MFRARFAGFCSECRTSIEVEDEVMYTEGQFVDELVHVGCAPKEEKPFVVCPSCFIAPCTCD